MKRVLTTALFALSGLSIGSLATNAAAPTPIVVAKATAAPAQDDL